MVSEQELWIENRVCEMEDLILSRQGKLAETSTAKKKKKEEKKELSGCN